ncbi:uncharacterized protein LOC115772351 isoform X2 [Archocentrus centrarchus]|uniref:uncharacterized protein LOC115772351 isoform X2 n=1 Tax=Archocentrus centrarchus TaxID=63155 RepID=UPI0011E9BFFB|nr:uncharacterized protein LOC115772351 isoform X2 [Archocentrus centrarchus]
MPSYAFLDSLENYLRTRKFPVNTSKNLKKLINNASKHFIYKDGCLWRSYRGRLLRVVRSDEEVRDILIQYHDNNNHAGWGRAVKEILLMFYWVGVTKAVKKWIKACAVCQKQAPTKPSEPRVQFCLVYGCDASSYIHPELSFHRFPKKAEQRQKWLAVAQRDEGSLRSSSYICSRHFDPSCFTQNEEGQLTLSSDAVPTITPDTAQEDEVPIPSDEEARSNTLEDFLSAAASSQTKHPSHPATDQSETSMELQEHQYCSSAPDSTTVQTVKEHTRRKTVIEATFMIYDHITRYLSHRILPMQSKKRRSALRRMAKRFGLIDGVLMYTRVSPPLRVPRSREEVNSILQEFHDNKGHYGQGICQREMGKHFYWATMTRDLTNWINNCQTCLNRTKRKWMRCSVLACTNCCGPVERRLGLTFHKFPLHNATLFAQWLKATGRSNWHPRLRSSICSIHFTEDCFNRSGEVIALNPTAVPTLMVHSDSAGPSRGLIQPAVGKEAIFAKYDAVELYLTKRTYPPGLNYVEKNTFRRFCKKFVIKDGVLHMGRGDRMRLVLRNRQQVETALLDYHNDLNHLDVNKCLRLLNERYFWKTMRPDVVQWINNCSQCSMKKRKKPNNQAEAMGSAVQLQASHDLDGVNEGDTDSCSSNGDEGRGSDSGAEGPLAVTSKDTVDEPSSLLSSQTVIPNNPQPRIPILLHLKRPINLQPSSPNIPFVTKLLPVKTEAPSHFKVQKDPKGSEGQTCIQIQVNPHLKKPTQPQEQKKTSSLQGNTGIQHCIQAQVVSDQRAPLEQIQPPRQNSAPEANTSTQISQRSAQRPVKKTRVLEANYSVKTSSSCGLEPVMALSTKPWPVFTIGNAALEQAAKPPPEADRSIRLQARTVVQQCSHAKVKIKPALDGTDAQWAEIQQGLVVYVCFFHGATEDVTHDMANKLMTTRLFRKNAGHSVSLLDLPGSILFVPQDSLLGKTAPNRRMQYIGGCELWWGAQLFSNLVSVCRELMSGSAKCTSAGVKVEHGLYGQKQEISLTSVEPLTVMLEF